MTIDKPLSPVTLSFVAAAWCIVRSSTMRHGLRMGEQQAPYRIHVFHAIAVDAIGLPQQMNGELAAAIRLRDRRNASLQEVFHRAEISSAARVVEGGILLQIERVQMDARKPQQVLHYAGRAVLARKVQWRR